jgi:hypothetical protein
MRRLSKRQLGNAAALAVCVGVVAALVLLVIRATSQPPAGWLAGRDYEPDSCRFVPPRRSLLVVKGFRPLQAGQFALETMREAVGTPAVIYIWGTQNRCVTEYSLGGGP